jgi:hypothetical protein
MYMGIIGFAMRSPQSPIYGETLASCTCAVYPLDFSGWRHPGGASVFHVLWLDHMYMGSKGFAMRSPRSLIYSETLASCTRAVYPLDFSGLRHVGGLVFSMCFGWLICTWES